MPLEGDSLRRGIFEKVKSKVCRKCSNASKHFRIPATKLGNKSLRQKDRNRVIETHTANLFVHWTYDNRFTDYINESSGGNLPNDVGKIKHRYSFIFVCP